jgi:hypothetical protein
MTISLRELLLWGVSLRGVLLWGVSLRGALLRGVFPRRLLYSIKISRTIQSCQTWAMDSNLTGLMINSSMIIYSSRRLYSLAAEDVREDLRYFNQTTTTHLAVRRFLVELIKKTSYRAGAYDSLHDDTTTWRLQLLAALL